MTVTSTITLRHSDKPDFEIQGSGVPNYLGAVALSPDGATRLGALEAGQRRCAARCATARTSTSRTPCAPSPRASTWPPAPRTSPRASTSTTPAWRARRLFDPLRQLSVRGARDQPRSGRARCAGPLRDLPLRRRPRAAGPGGLRRRQARCTSTTSWIAPSACSTSRALLELGESNVPPLATLPAVASEALTRAGAAAASSSSTTRATRAWRATRYMSCASCHNDGGHDGRTWDLTGMGEGLRNTVEPARPRRRAGLPALARQLRRGAGLRGADPRARRRHRPDERRRVQHRHAQPAARRRRRRA